MLDALSFNNGPPPTDPFDEMLRVLTRATFTQIEALLGTTANPARGHAGVQPNDCSGAFGVVVTFSVNTAGGLTKLGCFVPSGVSNITLESTPEDGRAAYANIPTVWSCSPNRRRNRGGHR